MVKAYVCKAAEWVTREALQIHGGYGYAEEYPVSRLYVDARVLSIFEGADETLCLRVIARRLMEARRRVTRGCGRHPAEAVDRQLVVGGRGERLAGDQPAKRSTSSSPAARQKLSYSPIVGPPGRNECPATSRPPLVRRWPARLATIAGAVVLPAEQHHVARHHHQREPLAELDAAEVAEHPTHA